VAVDVNFHREGAGEPLLLIHGLGCRWQMWLPVLAELSASRDVIAIDLPGFGFSPRPDADTDPVPPAGAATLTTLVSEWLGELGVERPHVAGFSLGGWVALELARRGEVRSATAISPAGFHNHWEGIFELASLLAIQRLARVMAPLAATLPSSPAMRKLMLAQYIVHGDRVDRFEADENLRALADCTWYDETAAAIVQQRFEPGEALDVPVTIAWGVKDRLLLPRQAPRAAQAVPGARLVMLPDCGHIATYDDPGLVSSVILETTAPSLVGVP
jgi:pimeloyl-ACP methyl ester carboxylesterase